MTINCIYFYWLYVGSRPPHKLHKTLV